MKVDLEYLIIPPPLILMISGMDPCDQARTPCEGRQDQVLGGDLPLLSPHQGKFEKRISVGQ